MGYTDEELKASGVEPENQGDRVTTKEQSANELDGMPTRALQRFRPSTILKANKELVKQARGIEPELLENKQAIKDVEVYAEALGNPNIIDNILVGGIEGSCALKHELVEINLLRKSGWDIYDSHHIEQIKQLFAQSIETGEPQNYIPFHLQAMKTELEYAQALLQKKGIYADLGMIAKVLYHLDLDEELFKKDIYTSKLEKTQLELEALGIHYPTHKPIKEELKNAL
ncbi:MAG: hypothetical protein DRR08_11135 [Candidatus Parabeggiatoa sp. nov. 2]|nr:MAG: hypothetical protein DRR08_11135 [Gammaproteobacteria bacterium]